MLAAARQGVEKRGLATVGVAHKRHIDFVFAQRLAVANKTVRNGARLARAPAGIAAHTLQRQIFLALGEDINHLGLALAERHIVAHNSILYGVVHWRILHRAHLHTPDEAHLHQSLAEAAVSRHADNHSPLSRL